MQPPQTLGTMLQRYHRLELYTKEDRRPPAPSVSKQEKPPAASRKQFSRPTEDRTGHRPTETPPLRPSLACGKHIPEMELCLIDLTWRSHDATMFPLATRQRDWPSCGSIHDTQLDCKRPEMLASLSREALICPRGLSGYRGGAKNICPCDIPAGKCEATCGP